MRSRVHGVPRISCFFLFSVVFIHAEQSLQDVRQRAQHAFRTGDSVQAVQLYEQLLETDVCQAGVCYQLGICYKRLGDYKKAIENLERALRLDENNGDAHLNLATCYEKTENRLLAAAHYLKAADLVPACAVTARYSAGTMYREAELFEQAIAAYQGVIDRNPTYVAAHLQMGNSYNELAKPKEALECYYKAIELDANNIQALYNFAFTLKRLNMVADARDVYDKVIQLKPDYASAYFGRSMCNLLLGNFKEGFLEYEWRWKVHGEREPHAAMPRWQGEDIAGKTILLHAEQGLGDTFQFIRYAQLVKERGARVVVQTQQPLERILKLCPYIDVVVPRGKPLPPFDVQCPLMSLPLIFGTTRSTVPASIPYLYADKQLQELWREKLSADKKFKVGICWQGNPNYSTSALRRAVAAKSMQLADFAPLAEIPGVSLYSVQKMSGEDQIAQAQVNLITFGDDFDTTHGRFMDTAAVIKNLDLVVTIDTSMGHFSAALGARTWVVLPNPPDWRWMLNCTDTPWYPNMRLFRQPSLGDWTSAMQEVAVALEQLVKGVQSGEVSGRALALRNHIMVEQEVMQEQTPNIFDCELQELDIQLRSKKYSVFDAEFLELARKVSCLQYAKQLIKNNKGAA